MATTRAHARRHLHSRAFARRKARAAGYVGVPAAKALRCDGGRVSATNRAAGMKGAPLPRDARRALFIYNLFFPLVFLALLPSFLARMLRRGGFRAKFGQRLGLYSRADRERWAAGGWIWIHSISVGETVIA